jgi:sugar-specific transcriptional regulator TrmB
MDIVTTLQKLGLTEKQATVYMAMLELGEAGMTKIAKKANLKRPTVYLIIDELNLLGLAGEILKGKKKFYSAAPKEIYRACKVSS